MRLLAVAFDAVGPESAFGVDSSPMFNNLTEKYLHGGLQSTKLPHTWPANMAIYEGIDRSDDFSPLINSSKHISWNESTKPMIFDILAKSCIKMGLMNLPLSDPVRPYNPFVIAHTTKSPPSLLNHHPKGVVEYLKNYRGDILNELGFDNYVKLTRNGTEALRLSKEFAVSKVEVFKTLCAKWEVDFGFIYFDFTDRIAHLIRKNNPVVKPMMLLCGDVLSILISILKPDHVLVFSDHGWGFYEDKQLKKDFPHHPVGFYIYTGKEGPEKEANILDLAPTILREFNIDPPSYMEGKPL